MKKKSFIKVKSYTRKKSRSHPRTKTKVKSYFRRFKATVQDKIKIYHQILLDLRFQKDDLVFTKRVSPSIMREALSILRKKLDSVFHKRDLTYKTKIYKNKLILNITSPCANHKILIKIINELINYTADDTIKINNDDYDIYISKMEILSEHNHSSIN